MRRLWFPLLIVLLLAACSSAPQRSARGSSESTASGGAFRTKPPGFPNFVDHSIGREEIPIQAMSLVGIPYRWGGNTPDSGFDCSGLVRYVFARSASVNLPRTTAEMSTRGESIEPDEIATGDLVFFNTTGRAHSHVGIYVGKLRFVNAPSTGGTVRLDYLTNPYWARHFDGIRRVASAKSAPAPFDAPTYQASRPPETPAGAAPPAAAAGYAQTSAGAVPATVPAAATAGYAQQAPVDAPMPAGMRDMPQAAASSRSVTTAQAPYASGTTAEPQNSPSPTNAAATARAVPDQFEPPPPALSAAQMQAREAGAVSPAAVAPPAISADERESAPRATVQATQPAAPVSSAAAGKTSGPSPDAIDAAADAFEPPPPAAVAQRQAREAQQTPPPQPAETQGTQIMRASTASHGQPIRSPSGDDPIARFANGSF